MSPDLGSTPSSRACAFPKQARVRKRREFLQIQNAGRRVATRHFLIVYACSGDGPPRLGITVTKKIGNAVVRNRVRRRLREAVKQAAEHATAATDYVVVARPAALTLQFERLVTDLTNGFEFLSRQSARA